MEVEWDPRKSATDAIKHGIDFTEAMTVFGDPFELTRSDLSHSEGESRFLSIGLSSTEHLLVVSYTESDDRIRLISAREASQPERHQYESRRS